MLKLKRICNQENKKSFNKSLGKKCLHTRYLSDKKVSIIKDLSPEVVYFQKHSHLKAFNVSSSFGHSKHKGRKGVLARCVQLVLNTKYG